MLTINRDVFQKHLEQMMKFPTNRFTGRRFLTGTLLLLLFSLTFAGCGKSPRVMPEIKPEKLTYKEGSLWPEQAIDTFLFKDNKAKSVGDTVTVLIIEDARAVNNLSRKTSRGTNFSANLSVGGSPQRYGIDGGSKFTGIGATEKSGSLKATVTAVVVEVLPNGNLKIDGLKELNVNEDRQLIHVTGIARAEDISRNNSIVSTYLAESRIIYSGDGALSSSQKPGYIGRFLALLWPF